MAVAHDASTEGTFTTVSPHTFTLSPVGVPRAVLVLIAHGSTSSDLISGVTCNGVTMNAGVAGLGSLITSDSAGEVGAVHGFWLGEDVRAGDQEISITHTGSADVKWVTAISVTANRSVTVYDANATSADQANPSVVITGGTQASLTYGVLYSGLDAVGSTAVTAGMSAVQDHDFGSFIARVDRQTTAAVGNFTFGYTSASDDVALIAFNVAEVNTVLFDGVGVCVEAAFGYGPYDTPGWYDLTTRVRGMSFGRGRSHELDQIQAGSASFLLDNQDGALNGHNTANVGAAWSSLDVKPMVPIRVTADYSGTSYPLWYGFVEGWPVSFPGQVDSVVTVSAVDLFKILSLGTMPETQQSVVDTLDPDAWWRFTGGGTTDSSGNSHTLTFAGSPTTGVAGAWTNDEATTFDGTNDTATVATETVLEYVDVDMTIAAWVNLNSAAGVQTLASSSVSGGVNPSWALSYNGGNNSWYWSQGTEAFTGSEAVDEWQHIAVTRSGTTITFYLNGVIGNLATVPTAGAATRTVHIGSINGTANWFNGEISELALWGTALTAAEISAIYEAQSDLLTEQLTSARIAGVLDSVGFTDYDLETGLSTMAASTDSARSILDEIIRAVDTEAGLFFIAPNGQPRFQDRHWRTIDQAAPIDTFADNGSDLPYVEIVPSYDDTQIWNEIAVTANDADIPYTASDETSKERYGQRTLPISTYPADANEAADRANWTLGLYKEPATRIDTLVLKPRGDADLWPVLLGAEISNRYTVEKSLAGDDLSQDVYLEAIAFEFQPKDCTVTLQLSPASSQSFWLLGEAGFSELDETTILGF